MHTGRRMQQQCSSIQRTLRWQTMREKHVIVLARELFYFEIGSDKFVGSVRRVEKNQFISTDPFAVHS